MLESRPPMLKVWPRPPTSRRVRLSDKRGLALYCPCGVIAAQVLDFEAAAITQDPAAGFLQAHQQGFFRVGSRLLLRRDLDLVEDSQIVKAPLGFEHRALIDRFAVVNQQFAIHQAQACVFVSQNHDVLDALLRSGHDLEFQVHLMGGFRRAWCASWPRRGCIRGQPDNPGCGRGRRALVPASRAASAC